MACPGQARLEVAATAGVSTLLRSAATSPLRLLTPRPRGQCVWAYLSSFGGGMVAGDRTRIEIKVDAGASCFLSTQASTKIYRNPEQLPCSHHLTAQIEQDALLVLAPDPVQCFSQSTYEQQQSFELAAGACLVLVDWMSSGRAARGERWAFTRYLSHNQIVRNGELMLFDRMLLDAGHGVLNNRFRTGGFDCLATVVIVGARLEANAKAILECIAAQPIAPRAPLAISASPLREGVILRIAGANVERVGHEIQKHLGFLHTFLSDDPWARKW